MIKAGHHRLAVVAAGLCLCLPTGALACVIDSQVCTTPSTGRETTYLTPMAENIDPATGSFVVFEAVKDQEGYSDLFLINCPAKSSIVVSARHYDGKGHWDAGDIMQTAIDSPKAVSFRELRNTLKAAGYDSAIRPIAADHCACDAERPLPVMGCGGDGP